jgi:hypothetical protein
VADDGYTYVNVTGGALYQEKPVTILVQFLLYEDDTFEFYAIEIDGKAFDYFTYLELIYKSYEKELISIVKNGALDLYPYQDMGTTFSNFLDDIEWELVIGEDYNVYVNINGTLLYYNEEAWMALQYYVDTVEMRFEYIAFEIDGIPQGYYDYLELLELVFD